MLIIKRLSGSLLLVFCGFCAAEDSDDDDFLDSISLQDLINIEVEVATKSKKSLSESPSTVSVYTRKEISGLGVTTLSQLLNLVPGMQSYAVGMKSNNPVLSSRGRRSSFNSFEILVLYDGQRLNGERNGSAFGANPQISLANIKRVEIIRGPGSAIYGSNAFTGIVNLVTDDSLNNVSASVASHKEYRTDLNYSTKWDDQSWSLFASGFDRDGESMTVTGFAGPQQSKDQYQGTDLYTRYQSEQLSLA